jgi:acyl-coenzyme A thioesterase PaaI-like protein
MGVEWYVLGERIRTRFTFGQAQQGPPGHAHGGAVSAILDEAMGVSVWLGGHQAMAANLNVDFVAPIPLGVEVEVEAWVTEVDGRKSSAKGRMVRAADGVLLAQATSLFVAVPEFFANQHEALEGT